LEHKRSPLREMSRQRSFRRLVRLNGEEDVEPVSEEKAGEQQEAAGMAQKTRLERIARDEENARGRRKMKKSRSGQAKVAEMTMKEIAELEKRIEAEIPEAGRLFRKDGKILKLFDELPLSQLTLSGLARGKFMRMTKIQQLAIPHSLAGRDVLGAARTGSGKTLAFVVPILERLYRKSWSPELGAACVIISPTRELAMQIYEVFRVVGFRHTYTVGLVLGGVPFREEQEHFHQMSVIVCTPGRLLQHLEQSVSADMSHVELLVLDEADRLLDMGFRDQLGRIIDYMPQERQTMLFSATQTKSVKDLARLSLRNPEKVSVLDLDRKGPGDVIPSVANDRGKAPTPANLAQAYSVCQLPQKLDMLYSFIRSHLKSKIIVFFSSCRQVKFVEAAFRKLRPGIPVMCIHGKIKHKKRMLVYCDFIERNSAVLFATDVAARGLDFPGVDWVVQADCPENVESYIHRVGRTARFKNRGHALLFLLPNEATPMVRLLRDANIPIFEKKVNPSRIQTIQGKLTAEIAKDQELKLNAQRAFKSYMRSVFLQTNKVVFDVKKLPMGAFAHSFGLANTPRLHFVGDGGEKSREELRKKKNQPYELAKLDKVVNEDASSGEDEDILLLVEKLKAKRKGAQKTKHERLLALKAADAVAQSQLHRQTNESDDESDDDDGLILRGTSNPSGDKELGDVSLRVLPSKKQLKKLRIDPKTGIVKGRVKPVLQEFHQNGDEVSGFEKIVEEYEGGIDDSTANNDDYVADVKARLEAADKEDQARQKELLRTRKRRLKEIRRKRELAEQIVEDLGGKDFSEDDDDDDAGTEATQQDERPPSPKRRRSSVENEALLLIQQTGTS